MPERPPRREPGGPHTDANTIILPGLGEVAVERRPEGVVLCVSLAEFAQITELPDGIVELNWSEDLPVYTRTLDELNRQLHWPDTPAARYTSVRQTLIVGIEQVLKARLPEQINVTAPDVSGAVPEVLSNPVSVGVHPLTKQDYVAYPYLVFNKTVQKYSTDRLGWCVGWTFDQAQAAEKNNRWVPQATALAEGQQVFQQVLALDSTPADDSETEPFPFAAAPEYHRPDFGPAAVLAGMGFTPDQYRIEGTGPFTGIFEKFEWNKTPLRDQDDDASAGWFVQHEYPVWGKRDDNQLVIAENIGFAPDAKPKSWENHGYAEAVARWQQALRYVYFAEDRDGTLVIPAPQNRSADPAHLAQRNQDYKKSSAALDHWLIEQVNQAEAQYFRAVAEYFGNIVKNRVFARLSPPLQYECRRLADKGGWGASQTAAQIEREWGMADRLAELEAAGTILVNFGGGINYGGNTRLRNYWVIAPDGHLRLPDVPPPAGGSHDGSKQWRLVGPTETALAWKKDYSDTPHQFDFAHRPVEPTPEQQVTLQRLQAEVLARWSSREPAEYNNFTRADQVVAAPAVPAPVTTRPAVAEPTKPITPTAPARPEIQPKPTAALVELSADVQATLLDRLALLRATAAYFQLLAQTDPEIKKATEALPLGNINTAWTQVSAGRAPADIAAQVAKAEDNVAALAKRPKIQTSRPVVAEVQRLSTDWSALPMAVVGHYETKELIDAYPERATEITQAILERCRQGLPSAIIAKQSLQQLMSTAAEAVLDTLE